MAGRNRAEKFSDNLNDYRDEDAGERKQQEYDPDGKWELYNEAMARFGDELNAVSDDTAVKFHRGANPADYTPEERRELAEHIWAAFERTEWNNEQESHEAANRIAEQVFAPLRAEAEFLEAAVQHRSQERFFETVRELETPDGNRAEIYETARQIIQENDRTKYHAAVERVDGDQQLFADTMLEGRDGYINSEQAARYLDRTLTQSVDRFRGNEAKLAEWNEGHVEESPHIRETREKYLEMFDEMFPRVMDDWSGTLPDSGDPQWEQKRQCYLEMAHLLSYMKQNAQRLDSDKSATYVENILEETKEFPDKYENFRNLAETQAGFVKNPEYRRAMPGDWNDLSQVDRYLEELWRDYENNSDRMDPLANETVAGLFYDIPWTVDRESPETNLKFNLQPGEMSDAIQKARGIEYLLTPAWNSGAGDENEFQVRMAEVRMESDRAMREAIENALQEHTGRNSEEPTESEWQRMEEFHRDPEETRNSESGNENDFRVRMAEARMESDQAMGDAVENALDEQLGLEEPEMESQESLRWADGQQAEEHEDRFRERFNDAVNLINHAQERGDCNLETWLDDKSQVIFQYNINNYAKNQEEIQDAINLVYESIEKGKASRIEMSDGRVMMFPKESLTWTDGQQAEEHDEADFRERFNDAVDLINQARMRSECRFESWLDDDDRVIFRYGISDDAGNRQELQEAMDLVVESVQQGKASRIEMPEGGVMMFPKGDLFNIRT